MADTVAGEKEELASPVSDESTIYDSPYYQFLQPLSIGPGLIEGDPAKKELEEKNLRRAISLRIQMTEKAPKLSSEVHQRSREDSSWLSMRASDLFRIERASIIVDIPTRLKLTSPFRRFGSLQVCTRYVFVPRFRLHQEKQTS